MGLRIASQGEFVIQQFPNWNCAADMRAVYCCTMTKEPNWHWLPCISSNYLHNGWLHMRLKIQYKWPALRVSQSWWTTDKQLSSSACVCERHVIQTHALYVIGIVGRDSRELCQLDPYVMVWQYNDPLIAKYSSLFTINWAWYTQQTVLISWVMLTDVCKKRDLLNCTLFL